MQYCKLSNTNLEISPIALGTWAYGSVNWEPSNERTLVASIHAARDHGINLIDTSPVYGGGRSEEIVGRAIKGLRDHFIVATKCGLIGKGKQTQHNLRKESIFQEIEGSLQRLKTDYIDLYQCHWPDPNTPIEETLEAFHHLQQSGKIRYYGVSNFTNDLVERALQRGEISSYQGQYSLWEKSLEKEIIPTLIQKKIGLLTYGSLGGGILTGKYETAPRFKSADARSFFYPYYKDDQINLRLKQMEYLRTLKKPINQIALNWVRQQKGVASVIVGCRTPEQVKQNAETTKWSLTDEELKMLTDWSRRGI